MERTGTEMDRLLAEGAVPSISVCVRVGGVERFHRTGGQARLHPRRDATSEQAYDLASVSKVVATVPVVAERIADGSLDLDASVRRFLPDVDPRITGAHLLSHSAGYPAWAPLYERFDDWGSDATRTGILQAAQRTALTGEPGTTHTYSDLGYLALCALLEAVGGDRLDRQLAPVLDRLGIDGLRWGWPGAAATEDCPVRGRVVEGEVHDLNCAAMGGISTHAGLFGTARAVARMGQGLLDALAGGGPLPSDPVRRLAHSRGAGSHRLGFDGISAGYTSTGSHFPSDTVGHLGYTGTSLWLVPSRGAVIVLLTNRVHPVDDLTAIRAARPRLHDAIATDLGWAG